MSVTLDLKSNVVSAANPDPQALVQAIDQKSFKVAETLIMNKADVNAKDKSGVPILQKAVVLFSPEGNALVRQVVLGGADCDCLKEFDIRLLVQRFSISPDEKEMLMRNVQIAKDAMLDRNELAAQKFLECTAPAPKERPESKKDTSIPKIRIVCDSEQALLRLIDKYKEKVFDLPLRGDHYDGEYTAVHWAIQFASVEGIKKLIELGLDPNAVNKNGDTLLHQVVRMLILRESKGFQIVAIVRILLANRADPTIGNKKDKENTVLHVAVEGLNVPRILEHLAVIIPLLLENNASFNRQNKKPEKSRDIGADTPLHILCRHLSEYKEYNEVLANLLLAFLTLEPDIQIPNSSNIIVAPAIFQFLHRFPNFKIKIPKSIYVEMCAKVPLPYQVPQQVDNAIRSLMGAIRSYEAHSQVKDSHSHSSYDTYSNNSNDETEKSEKMIKKCSIYLEKIAIKIKIPIWNFFHEDQQTAIKSFIQSSTYSDTNDLEKRLGLQSGPPGGLPWKKEVQAGPPGGLQWDEEEEKSKSIR